MLLKFTTLIYIPNEMYTVTEKWKGERAVADLSCTYEEDLTSWLPFVSREIKSNVVVSSCSWNGLYHVSMDSWRISWCGWISRKLKHSDRITW